MVKRKKKIKLSKSKILILTFTAFALIFSVTSGTLAWLSSITEPVVNTFTYGDINITLTETDTFDDDNQNTNTYEMVPGNKITKDPLIIVEENSEDSYLFVKLEKTSNFDNFMEYEIVDSWKLLDGTENIYYQEISKKTEKQKVSIIKNDEIQVKENVTKKMLNDLDKNGKETFPQLVVTAYAVQRNDKIETISTAEKAWSLINDQNT